MLTVLLGGARSGKSSAAVRAALDHDGPVTYIATCPRIEGDTEIAERIEVHQAERPPTWATIEAEHDVVEALKQSGDSLVIVDCLTLWVSNLLHRGDTPDEIAATSAEAAASAAARSGRTLVVTNEVGLGIVPDSPSVRTYRDVLGRVNQQWVAAADQALFLVAGRALPLRDLDEYL